MPAPCFSITSWKNFAFSKTSKTWTCKKKRPINTSLEIIPHQLFTLVITIKEQERPFLSSLWKGPTVTIGLLWLRTAFLTCDLLGHCQLPQSISAPSSPLLYNQALSSLQPWRWKHTQEKSLSSTGWSGSSINQKFREPQHVSFFHQPAAISTNSTSSESNRIFKG